jgi:general secretion pathway protein D
LASDNKEAQINISTEVPVASTTYDYRDSDDDLLQTNIEYRNTGVILSVTPHINEFGLVSMDVSQEVSEQGDPVDLGTGTQSNPETRPSFLNRSIDTSLTVKSGQTIVIGGLIRENESRGRAAMPCLGEIPVLSYVFGKKQNSIDKTELIVFITPKVIATLDDVDSVSEEFRNRIDFKYEDFWRTSPREPEMDPNSRLEPNQ